MSNSASLDDAKAIQALLVQLGQSQALKEVRFSENEAGTSSSPNTSVASLLSQLQTSSTNWSPHQHANAETSIQRQEDHTKPLNPIPISDFQPRSESLENNNSVSDDSDLRHYNFQQSLPILAELANRQDCVDMLVSMKKNQDALERQLVEERMSIKKKYEQKIKDALFKARLVGSGLSPHEARMLNNGYRDELRKFDRERAISAWEILVAEQQERLSSLGVPAMFPTHVASEREAQRKVIHVLEGLIGNAP